MEKLIVGKVTKLHGVKGGLKVVPIVDDEIDFVDLRGVFTDFDDVFYEFEDVFAVSDCLGVKLKGVNSVEDANKFVGKFIYADKDILDKLVDENSFYIEDLKGSKVYLDNDNNYIGVLDEIDNFGSADIFYIKSDKYKNLSLPHVEGVVNLFKENDKKLYLNKTVFDEVAVYGD